jgi:hypothetical protein
MCRNIKTLFNYDPPATEDEIYASSLQYVRKISGFRKPSKSNNDAFEVAVADIAKVTKRLVDALETGAPQKDRIIEMEKARARAEKRFA